MAPPASAGFLDFLFKPASPSVAEPPSASVLLAEPRDSETPAPRPLVVHPLVHHTVPVIEVRDPPCCKSGEDPYAYLMHDKTLRPGDAVMTPNGIRIFEGPVAARHGPNDFAPLAAAKNVESKNRTELAQVDARPGQLLPAQVLAQKPSKPETVAQWPGNKLGRLAMADR